MNDIEKRIAAAIERITSGHASMRVPAEETDPDLVLADCLAEIRRLRALTPPEGYVLVPVEPTAEMLQAAAFGVAGESGQKFKPMMSAGYSAMLAARPEVSP